MLTAGHRFYVHPEALAEWLGPCVHRRPCVWGAVRLSTPRGARSQHGQRPELPLPGPLTGWAREMPGPQSPGCKAGTCQQPERSLHKHL